MFAIGSFQRLAKQNEGKSQRGSVWELQGEGEFLGIWETGRVDNFLATGYLFAANNPTKHLTYR